MGTALGLPRGPCRGGEAMRRALGIAACLLSLALAGCQPPARPAASGTAPAGNAPAPGAQAPPAAPLKHLDLGYVAPSETFSIPWVAKETGIFARYGLDVDLHLVPGTPR